MDTNSASAPADYESPRVEDLGSFVELTLAKGQTGPDVTLNSAA